MHSTEVGIDGVQKGSLDAPDAVGASGSDSTSLVDPPGGLSNHTPNRLKELSFAGNLHLVNAHSKKLASSAKISKQIATNFAKQSSAAGSPSVAKDATLDNVFSFPRVVPGEGGDEPTKTNAHSLEANKNLMADLVRKGRHEVELAEGIDVPIKTEDETFKELLERMSGSHMVARAIEDITAYSGGQSSWL